MRSLLKQTESKVKDKDLTPIFPFPKVVTGPITTPKNFR
jgi:hypothetical protein